MSTLQTALQFLDDARQHRVTHKQLPERAVAFSEALTELALSYATPNSRAHDAQLARMLEDPQGKAFTVAMADRVFREPTEQAAATTLQELVAELGAPGYLAPFDRLALSVGAIALSPTGNAQGDYFFMSLASGKRLSRASWTALPMTDAAIARVEALALHQGQPLLQATGLVVEWRPDQPIDDSEYDLDYAPPCPRSTCPLRRP